MQGSNIRTLRDGWSKSDAGMFVCAGPCSAESLDQVMKTAEGLAPEPLTFFRAGVWKPRTRPGTFEGAGDEALAWLVEVRQRFGFAVCTEVGTAQHVESALRHGLDVLWIGARTTPNPYAVQEIASALRGVDVPVLVKNPVSPDLELWLGAMERLLCDPSHMCGRRDLIFGTAQEALDLLYDGLMVEVHHDLSQARSDAAQQLTPAQFRDMMARLVVPHESSDEHAYQLQMRNLRHAIDEIDEEIVALLARRMAAARLVGESKRRVRVSTLQPARVHPRGFRPPAGHQVARTLPRVDPYRLSRLRPDGLGLDSQAFVVDQTGCGA